ncbi:MAG: ligase-associated DNA damage response DEXH box helicase, partial [Halofilum sp. (in: g-proteobacteria)]
SLSLLLSYADTQRQLAGVTTVVIDEWHELLGSKRGALLELALARIRALAPGVCIQGLSATLANLDEALAALTGPHRGGRLVRGLMPRETVIDTVRPATLERFPWAGHLGLQQLQPVLEAIDGDGTTLVFTNTRSQAERWFEAILRARPDWLETTAMHHGSLDRDVRRRVEDGLRDRSLRRVVATSSLDLGVDFSPVDRVVQVGSPKGVARLLQRAGRSGHGPGRTSALLCVPTHALELLEAAAARRGIEAGRVEARRPLRHCLDVLAQHLVTLAAGGGFQPDAARVEVEDTAGFAGLADADWQWVLDFIRRGGQALKGYPEFRRVIDRGDGQFIVGERRILQRHRMAIGTITADAAMTVRFVRGGRLGTIEESFISRLRPGDVFLFGGRMLELARVRDLTAYVRLASKRTTAVPRWQGGRLPLSTELADGMRALLADYAANEPVPPELDTLRPILDLQQRWSALPVPGTLLAETVRSREGVHLFVYPFAGRSAHEGLAALVAWRLSRSARATLHTAVNDYGFEVVGRGLEPPTGHALHELLLPGDDLAGEIEACLNAGEMARRRFREIARVAGLVFQGYPGQGKSARQLQASSGLVYDVLVRHDPDNRLVGQAAREAFENELDGERLRAVSAAMAASRLVHCEPPRLTPLAFPLWAERVQHRVSSESWVERVQAMVERLERAAPGPSGES